MSERRRFERELEDLGVREHFLPPWITFPPPPTIGFEFDLNYGIDRQVLAALAVDHATWPQEHVAVTDHNDAPGKDGFKVKLDGPRYELATEPFEIWKSGKARWGTVLKDMRAFTTKMNTKCGNAKADKSVTITLPSGNAKVGHPRHFTLGEGPFASIPILPLGETKTAFRESCGVAGVPQATITIPMARVDDLVSEVKTSEPQRPNDRRPGQSLSGYWRHRQGLRSQALYDAQSAVNKSRNEHIRRKTRIDATTIVTDRNFTKTLQGFMILLVSYLRTSQLKYDFVPPKPNQSKSWDYEGFAKAYLPINVKTPFRLLFKDPIMSDAERKVFLELYGNPAVRDNLFALAEKDSTKRSGTNMLFPEGPNGSVRSHQEVFFNHAPTWDEFVDKTIKDDPLKVEKVNTIKKKKHALGDEVLFAPLITMIPQASIGTLVPLELRRMGFAWLNVGEWTDFGDRLFALVTKLNS
ncbi:MAG: hypothetical protein ABW034_11715 [Steroidobacteraceae bacterium]